MHLSCHILNGDALNAHFPNSIGGELIVARECLVEGPVQANSLKALFRSGKSFMVLGICK